MIDFGHGGVSLGPLESGYSEIIRSWRNNRSIFAWCRQKTVISDLEQERWIDAQSKNPSIQMFGIFRCGEIVGVCGFTDIDHFNRRAEFSLYIAPEHQRKGFATFALKTLFSHGFKDLGFETIWGETFDGNPASFVFEGIGMRREGTRRQFYFKNGKLIDAHLYSVLRSEWLS